MYAQGYILVWLILLGLDMLKSLFFFALIYLNTPFDFFFPFLSDSLVCSCILPLSSISTGYQHIYLSEDVQFTSPPPSLFIHAIVCQLKKGGKKNTAHFIPESLYM